MTALCAIASGTVRDAVLKANAPTERCVDVVVETLFGVVGGNIMEMVCRGNSGLFSVASRA